MNPVLTIDPEFEAKCPPLTEDELSQLEENILEEGLVLMPLIVWNDTIVDGHNRYRIAQAHPGIEFRTHEKQFSNRYEALSWICKNQLGRRNLTPQQKKYLIGQRYDAEKKTHGGDRKSNLPESSGQNDHLIAAQKTRERIASETGTSESYVMEAIVRRVNSSPKYRKQTATLQGRLDAAKRALKRCNGLYDSLYQSYVDQLMTEQEYMTLKRRYKAEAEEAERLIEALTRSQAAEAAHTPENPFLAAFGSFRGADVLTKEMAQALIERVYVDGDSNIEIVFRYRDEYKELCTYLEGRDADA